MTKLTNFHQWTISLDVVDFNSIKLKIYIYGEKKIEKISQHTHFSKSNSQLNHLPNKSQTLRSPDRIRYNDNPFLVQ